MKEAQSSFLFSFKMNRQKRKCLLNYATLKDTQEFCKKAPIQEGLFDSHWDTMAAVHKHLLLGLRTALPAGRPLVLLCSLGTTLRTIGLQE